MKWMSAILVLSLVATVWSWTAQDREIFALRESVENDLGKGYTFYDWLGLDRKADHNAIGKAYKKLSIKLHPDKNPSKSATDRFSRLGLVYKILRGPDRERYDFFLDNGFPRWKGTDYYYSRYRPGLGAVLIFLYIMASGAQYAFLYITSQQHRNHMSGIIDQALQLAGVSSTKRKVMFENGMVFMVYPDCTVFLVDDDGEHRLNVDDITTPTWKDTIIYTIPLRIFCKISGSKYSSHNPTTADNTNDREDKVKNLKIMPKPAVKVGSVRRRKK